MNEYFARVAERLNPIGIILLVVGALIGFLAKPLSVKLFKDKAEAAMLPIKFIGLCLVVASALVILFT